MKTNASIRAINSQYDRLNSYETNEQRNKAIEQLKNAIVDGNAYTLHHSASRRGYLSRKGPGSVERYNGRFGTGYLLASPRWDTSQYVDIYYYTLPEE